MPDKEILSKNQSTQQLTRAASVSSGTTYEITNAPIRGFRVLNDNTEVSFNLVDDDDNTTAQTITYSAGDRELDFLIRSITPNSNIIVYF